MITRMRHTGGWKRRGGFTLFEMLIVIGILVTLVAILVPSLGRARDKARATQTLALMSNLASDIETYYQHFHAYPGPLPASVSASSNTGSKISGAQNMLLGLTYPMTNPTNNPIQPPGPWPFTPYTNVTGPVDYASMNPTGSFDQLPPYFPPTKQVALARGATSNAASSMPVVYDTFSDPLPILYFRRTPGVSTPAAAQDNSSNAAYYVAENAEYLNAPLIALDGMTLPQGNSVNSGQAGNYYATDLAFAVTNGTPTPTFTGSAPTPPTTARGGFVLISAGIDRYYGSYKKPNSSTWSDDDLILVGGE